MKFKSFALASALFATAFTVHAGEVYVGAGFPGLTLGYSHTLSPTVKLRGEYAGGLSLNKDGKTGGVNYNAKIKTNRVGAFADWFPTSTGFHLTGGITASDIGGNFTARGGAGQTINNKPVDLTGKELSISVTYPDVTPYIGMGWSSKPSNATGWGFYGNIGLQIGKFKTNYTENGVIGSGGITQADVEVEVNKVRDAVNKLSVLPSVSLGLTYRF
ncbi:MAG: hypothetical protein U1D25_01965 [Hydrogenophaga sp.]|uniref:hypothetical protein n=1 Tax=Hydrogenophaga sp. TaxID=1904254 RepID=UPI002746F7B6|nr:hypothetical protein [Hydrogenophaga sp.]MDP2416473.1 hypothetical protein [Hydrogenophaga sp.]MDZ4186861.1 hypothetical protein [Hydrogenophaga sp.]